MMPPANVIQVVTGRSMAEILAGRDAADADLVELRLDGVVDLDMAAALANRRLPVIVTVRAPWEGGFFDGSEAERMAFLAQAIRLGAEYVDVEFSAPARHTLPPAAPGQLVLSSHDFAGIPSDLAERVSAMRAERPGVVKVAVTPSRLSDAILLRDHFAFDEPHVAIAMGPAGQITRLCPALFGSCWTYAGTNAPGQVSASMLRDVFRVPRVTASTVIYGVTGRPLGHSASPAMHNALMAHLGMDAVYLPFETDNADELLRVAEAFGVRGLSVTAPLKETLFARVPTPDDTSRRIGACNTLLHTPHGWEGRNFDVAGMLSPLDRRHGDLAGRRVVVLGAGGAGRMAVWAMTSRGARVEVSARRADRAAVLAAEFGAAVAAWPPPPGWDLLINTTPVGTWPRVDDSPLEREALVGGTVYDLIYNPDETTLLRWARERGIDTIGGLEMLVGQACLQFAWWTGQEAMPEVMTAAARAFVQRGQRQV